VSILQPQLLPSPVILLLSCCFVGASTCCNFPRDYLPPRNLHEQHEQHKLASSGPLRSCSLPTSSTHVPFTCEQCSSLIVTFLSSGLSTCIVRATATSFGHLHVLSSSNHVNSSQFYSYQMAHESNTRCKMPPPNSIIFVCLSVFPSTRQMSSTSVHQFETSLSVL
jgi:hypothetical protein